MKHLKVSLKLIVSFVVVIIFAIIASVIGIVGMSMINSADDALYNDNVVAISAMGKINDAFQEQRLRINRYVVYAPDSAEIQRLKDEMSVWEATLLQQVAIYNNTIVDESAEVAYRNAMRIYETEFADLKENVRKACLISAQAGHDILADDSTVRITTEMVKGFETAMTNNDAWAKEAVQNNTVLFNTLTLVSIGVLIVAIGVAMFFALYISSLISKPLGKLSVFLSRAGLQGDMTIAADDQEIIRVYSQHRDEIGHTIGSAATFITHVTKIADELEKLSNGDLTIEIDVLSDKDLLGVSLSRVEDNLNRMFSEINSSASQVSSGSKQVADGAQALAQGSTEQAASIEELSSSIAEIAEKTKVNAQTAGKTAKLSETIRDNAVKGGRQMDDMIVAVKEINEASHSISKIIKTIDDIAFQTNILALNAAVEAARAGQHGKGFAVVAEEVRNLASKSAEAAKDTGDMIKNSMEKAELGSTIAEETATSLKEIVEGINESSQLIYEMANASDEQAQGISQVNIGIDQVAQVVQQNSATAEQSAAASEQMSGQSDILQQLISQFKLKEDAFSSSPRQLPKGRSSLVKPHKQAPGGGGMGSGGMGSGHGVSGDFGKY